MAVKLTNTMSSSTSSSKPITDTVSLGGLRTIFNFSVVTFHAAMFLAFVLDNPQDSKVLFSGGVQSKLLRAIQTLGNGSVDIFLLISGFLLKSAFAHTAPTLSSSLRYIVFRYLRLAPAYLSVAFTLRALKVPTCIAASEIVLLRFDDTTKLCIPSGWSTQVDFVSHMILLPLLAFPKILASLLVLIPQFRLYIWLQRGRPILPRPATIVDLLQTPADVSLAEQIFGVPKGNFSLTDPDIISRKEIAKAYHPLYFWVSTRIPAVVVGVLLYSCMQQKTRVYRLVRKFPALSTMLMVSAWGLFHTVERYSEILPVLQYMHYAAGRMLLAMATSVVIILTCSIEDSPSDHRISRVLRAVLSCKPMRLLGKLSYVVYLLHITATPALTKVPPVFTRERLTAGWVIVLSIKWYLCTILLALPFWGVENVALRGRKWVQRMVLRRDREVVEGKKNE